MLIKAASAAVLSGLLWHQEAWRVRMCEVWGHAKSLREDVELRVLALSCRIREGFYVLRSMQRLS